MRVGVKWTNLSRRLIAKRMGELGTPVSRHIVSGLLKKHGHPTRNLRPEIHRGFMHLNTSHETSELACDSIAAWWENHGQKTYPKAKKLLILCDGGGSNSSSRYVFKEGLQKLANRLGIEVRIAHYPRYCSKYNPIEHRLFPHVTRACRGVIFRSLETVQHYISKTTTSTGLTIKAGILDKVYETGLKCAVGFKKKMKIAFDKNLPKWNYRAVPQPIENRKLIPA